jgi:hypothetical protein
MLRRFAKITGEPDELFDIHTLRMRCQVADLHVLDHATAEVGSSTTLLRDEQRHMAPSHRLAVELSDQSAVAEGGTPFDATIAYLLPPPVLLEQDRLSVFVCQGGCEIK